MAKGILLHLSAPAAGASAGEAWARVGRFVLGLDAAGAQRFWGRLPASVLIGAIDEAAQGRATRELASAGVAASFEPASEGEVCGRHGRALAAAVCPRCERPRACSLCLLAEVDEGCAACAGKARFSRRFQRVRVAILLAILALTAGSIELRRRLIRSWNRVLTVGFYPVATSAETRAYAASLSEADLAPLAAFMQREAGRYGVRFAPLVQVRVGRVVAEAPPEPPDDASPLAVARWSLALRAYSFRMRHTHSLPDADVEFFVLFHPPGSPRTFDRSLAIERLRVAIVHAEADAEARGWLGVGLAHELLHVAGASDKYDTRGAPVAPSGYAEPDLQPLHPQRLCEIMGGQVPLSDQRFREPLGLDECLVGPATAAEIGWGPR